MLDFISPTWCYERVPAFKKKNCRFHLDLATGENISSHGGQIIVDSLATRFDLWNSLAAIPGLDPRKRLTTGFTPTAIIAQMMVALPREPPPWPTWSAWAQIGSCWIWWG